jgi:TPR repeat protein
MIGNPQVDLPDQGSAYENLKDKGSYISGPEDKEHIEAAYYLAECYVTGKTGDGGPDYARNQNGFPPNRPEAYELALPLYENAAQYDHIPSLVKLSAIYADEKYALKDLDKSLTYLINFIFS